MVTRLPGTKIPLRMDTENQFQAALTPIFSVTNGLTLSQVAEITGLECSTIQNWVKRGWVAKPKEKRYGEPQLVRIILMNALRGTMKLERIAALMTYLNGSVEDTSDDIIPEKELICMLERVLRRYNQSKNLAGLEQLVRAELASCPTLSDQAKEKLFESLYIITLACLSALLRSRCELRMDKILNS